MPRQMGGPSPDEYGFKLTMYAPAATEAAPIEEGQPLVYGPGPYEVAPAPAGTADLIAKGYASDGRTPVAALVIGTGRVDTLAYTGAAPTIGASMESDGAGAWRVAAAANGTRVLYVDTARGVVDLLV